MDGTHPAVFCVRVKAVVVVRRAGQIAGARKVAHISTPGDLHLADLWIRRPPVDRIHGRAPRDSDIRSDGGGGGVPATRQMTTVYAVCERWYEM